MNKKTLAVILEIIPIVSVITALSLVFASLNNDFVRKIILVAVVISFFGFVFGIIARKLAKGDKLVKVLSIFDFLCPVIIIALYVITFIAIGMSL